MEEVGISVKEFSKTFLGQEVHFHILKLKQSFLLWIGTDEAQPIATQLLGNSTDTFSSNLARSLALKTGCQCFVSLNISDQTIQLLVKEHVSELCVTNPSMFFF